MLLAIADHANDQGKAWPSVPTLAKKTRISTRYAGLILSELRSDGAIKVTERPGTSNIYQVITPEAEFRGTPEVDLSPPLRRDSAPPEADLSPPLRPTSDKPLINHQVNHQTESSTTTTPAPIDKSDEAQPAPVVVVGDDGLVWPVEQICQASGQPVTFSDPKGFSTFISYWLYAIEHSSINNPIRWAEVNTQRGGQPAKKYREMVIAGPSRVISGDYYGTAWGDSARAMCSNGLRDLLAPMIGLDTQPQAWDDDAAQEDETDPEPLYPPPHPRIHKRNGSTMTPAKMWQAAKGQIQMEMPKAAFDTWVRDIEIHDYDEGTFVLITPNAAARDWVASRLFSSTQKLLTGIANKSGIEVQFITPSEAQ